MNDTIVFSIHFELLNTKLITVSIQCINLFFTDRVFDRLILIVCWDIMIWHCINMIRPINLKPTFTHSVKSLRRSYLMAIQTVDIKLRRSVLDDLHYMLIPNLIK